MFEMRPYRNAEMNVWNPFSDMEKMEREFFGNHFFNNRDLTEFKTDITDEGDHFELKADLPGFKKENIKLDINGDTLTIHAERHSEHEDKDKANKYICCERSYGSYSRNFDMTNIKTAEIQAFYDGGVLDLKLPKKDAETHESTQIQIN